MNAQEIIAKILGILAGLCQLLYWYLEALYRQFVPPPMKTIDGETILVTGAVGGIGKEICRHIVRSGSDIKLVLWDLNQNELEKLAGELKKSGNGTGLKVFPFAVDISTKENIDECCQKVKDTVGKVSIIFNNAGIAPTGNFLQLSDEQIDKTIQINLMSHLWIIRQFLPDMVTNNKGRIVNICSMGGLVASAHALPYFAAKFGVNGYSEALKMELGMFKYDGIKVSTVYPYFVKTPLIKTLGVNEQGKALPSAFQLFLEPEDVGRKTVDGMRREYEFIYLPPIIPLILLFDFLVPMKFRKSYRSKFSGSLAYKDEAEHKRLAEPFGETIKNAKGKKKTK